MKYVFPFLVFIFIHASSEISAQANSVSDTNKVSDKPEIMPEFPGGEDSLNQYIIHHVKPPKRFTTKGPVGESVVHVDFIVNREGYVVKAHISKSVGWGCDAEALRVVKNMPRWKPGILKGEKVNVSFTLPIKFILEE